MTLISNFKNMFGNLWKYKPPDSADNLRYTENVESEKMRNPEDLQIENGIEAPRFFEEAFGNSHVNPISSRKMPQNDEPNGTSLEPTKYCLKFEESCLKDELGTPSTYHSQAANIKIFESESLSQDKDEVSQGCLNEAHEIFGHKEALNSVDEKSHVLHDGQLYLDVEGQSNRPMQVPGAKMCSPTNEESYQKLSSTHDNCDSSKAESVLGTAQPQLVPTKSLNQQNGARLEECLSKEVYVNVKGPLHWTKVSQDKSFRTQVSPEQRLPWKKLSLDERNSGHDDQGEFLPGQRYPRYKLPEQLSLEPDENGLAEVLIGSEEFLNKSQLLYCSTVKIWDSKFSKPNYNSVWHWHEHLITEHLSDGLGKLVYGSLILVDKKYKNIIYNINQNGFEVNWLRNIPTHIWICPLCTYVARKIRPLNHCVLRIMQPIWDMSECPCELCCQYRIRIISSDILKNCMLVHGNLSKTPLVQPKLNSVNQSHRSLPCQDTQLGVTVKTYPPTTSFSARMSNGKEDSFRYYPGGKNMDNQNILINGYVIDKSAHLLGKGAFGLVFQATRIRDESKVVLKMIKAKNIYEWVLTKDSKVPLEVFILSKLRQANIIRLLDAFVMKEHIILIFPRDMSIDLYKYMLRYGPLAENTARCIFSQVLNAVGYCWSHGIVHRDLKCQNIIINKDTNLVKVIDFGSAAMMDKDDAVERSFTGTRAICPPEFFTEDLYLPEEATVWSLGIILFDAVHDAFPFKDEEDIIEVNYLEKQRVEISEHCNNLIIGCFNYNYEKRIKLASISSHPWLEILPDFPVLRSTTLPITVPGSDKFSGHANCNDLDGNRDVKKWPADKPDKTCTALDGTKMVLCDAPEQNGCKTETRQGSYLGTSSYIFYSLFVFLLLISRCETYFKNCKIVCMGSYPAYMPECGVNKPVPTLRIPHAVGTNVGSMWDGCGINVEMKSIWDELSITHAVINVKPRHATFPIDEEKSQLEITRLIEPTKYLKLSQCKFCCFLFLFCQHSAQLDMQVWPVFIHPSLQPDTVVKVCITLLEQGNPRPPTQKDISMDIMLSLADSIIFSLLNMVFFVACCGLICGYQHDWIMFSSRLVGYCLGSPGETCLESSPPGPADSGTGNRPALPLGRASSLSGVLGGKVPCHCLDYPSGDPGILIIENAANKCPLILELFTTRQRDPRDNLGLKGQYWNYLAIKGTNLIIACLHLCDECVPHWVSQQPTCSSVFLHFCSYIIFLQNWDSLPWVLAVVIAKSTTTMDGGETPCSIRDEYVLNKHLLESKI